MSDAKIGIPPGVEGALGPEGMDAPPLPLRRRDDAARLLREFVDSRRDLFPPTAGAPELSVSESPQEVVQVPVAHADTRRLATLVDAANTPVEFPPGFDRAWVGFVDFFPRARWGHAAWWVFVPTDDTPPIGPVDTIWPAHPDGQVRFLPVESP